MKPNFRQQELFPIPDDLLVIDLNEELEMNQKYQGSDVSEYI